MRIGTIFAWITALSLLMMAGCQGISSLSADEAAKRQILNRPAVGEVIDPASITALQRQTFEGSTYGVLSYKSVWDGQRQDCLRMIGMRPDLLAGWKLVSSTGSCIQIGTGTANTDQLLEIFSGTDSRADQKKPDISRAFGKVNDNAIVKVRIVWQDGQSQEVQVVNSSYIAIRTGKAQLKTAEGFDSENAVIAKIAR